MGKATGLMKELSGKIGPLQFQQTKSGKVAVFVAPEVPDTPLRTKKQMEIRLAWGNLGAVYSQFHKTLKRSHEGLAAGTSDYNAFIKENTRMTCVYLKKSELANGGCVLAPYKISDGKLPSIYYDADDQGVLVTDIELGDLVIGEETTVSEFSVAVLTLNDDYEDGDQITFFYGVQMVEPGTGVPRAKIKGQKVKLDVSDDTLLWSCVTGLGFSTVDGYLGMNISIENGAAAWVHSREDEQGTLKVSSQKMTVDSSVLASYMGDAAFEASVQSYGGITNRKVFLRPDDETNVAQGLWYGGGAGTGGSTSGGNGGSSQGGNTGGGTNTGGNTGGGTNTGGNTGGGSGSVTPSTPKLTISRSGTGTSTVSVNGEGVSSGAEIAGGTEVTVSVTPAEGATPTASLNGNTVTLTESEGVYTGSFSMPSGNATLVINSGGASGGGSGDMN